MRVKIGNEWLTLSSLAEHEIQGSLNEYEKKTIQFCQNWLNDKQDFEFNTSGSTGNPKAIKFKREQLISSAQLTAKALELRPGSTSLVCLDTDLIAGAMMVVRSLVTGMNMIVQAPSANPLEKMDDPIDFAAIVPYQLSIVLDQTSSKLNLCDTIIIGGAPLRQDVIELLQPLSTKFYATYGMTETITHVALQKLNGPDRQSYFQLLPEIQASVDSRNCLVIEANHLGPPVITNDIVEIIDKNKFRWIGRYDQVINSGGVKISPEKIERIVEGVFQELKINNRFFVTGLGDSKLGEQVALIIEGSKQDQKDEKIRIQLSNRLKKYEVPKTLYVQGFIETATQKIDRLKTVESIGRK